jgi:serine/threonine-protein kinase HipA
VTNPPPARRLALEVRVYGELVGHLHRDREARTRFSPDASWLSRGQRPPLGLALLAQPGPRLAGTGLPLWFDNLLPELGSALRGRICRQLNLRESDAPALLRAVGHDLPGAVEVSGDADEDESSNSEPVPEGRLRFSLAGMQLKLSMLRSDDRFALPARGQTGRWIVKIAGERLPELVEVEGATMAWARRAGFSVPRHQVLPAEALIGVDRTLIGQAPSVFAIERFDRQPEGSRVHQEDFAQALEIGASHKYGDTGPRRTSYDGLARLVRDASGPEAQGDFIERVAFVVASGNDDAHLKNWSFQWGRDHRPRLAPCYDLVSTISWPEFGWQRTGGPSLALALGRSRRFANLDLERLERFVERAEAADGRARFLGALERARAEWPLVAESAPQRMREAVAEHWRAVPLLRYVGLLPRSTQS